MQISIPIMNTITTHANLHGGGFEAGFYHPVLGVDHFLAMVAVGILSTQMGGRAIYIVPLTFIMIMFVGSLFGFLGITLVNDELGIALSVVLLGVAIAINKKFHILLGMGFVAFFAFFHGHAHGIEMPKIVSLLEYVSGFMLATLLLHIGGVIIGLVMQKVKTLEPILPHIGSAITGIGLYILYNLF
jgi:urease accessory protein